MFNLHIYLKILTIISLIGIFATHTWALPANITPLFDRDFLPKARELISKAKHSIDIAIYIFKTDNAHRNVSAQLQEDIILAAKRGVKVRVLFDHPGDTKNFVYEVNLDTAKEFNTYGIETYFDDPKRRMHVKMMVIDNRFVLLGSHNYTVSGMSYNNEASVLIDSEAFARNSRDYIEQIIRKSRKIR